MKKLIVLLLLIPSALSFGQQYNMGFGVRAGVANFLGDIGGGDEARGFVYNMELKDTRWTVGGFWRYRFHPMMALQTAVTYGRIEGADSESENRARQGRNLSFKNDLIEASAKFEFYPQILSVNDVGYRGRYRLDFQTYFLAGAGLTFHSPKAELNGEWIKLRPLMTEGYRYTNAVFSMPLGMGFFFTYKRQHRIGFEYTWSLTFTDYLDDISDVYVDPTKMSADPNAQILANRWDGNGNVPHAANYTPGNKRGDPTGRDNFMFMTVSYSYLLRTKSNFYRRNYSWLYGRKRLFKGKKPKF